ncbi:lysozyme C, milk isozyme [Pempheris klunzingeri]|uniref:lysozyme C, milk isozyme n=1 Tax=Pempheris klunzingeri TaxID=3127111 RepID=UPI00397F3521
MKGLVVFLLAVLGCSLAEGIEVQKCALKDKLAQAIGHLLGSNGEADSLLAKIICHVELGSNFDTNTVTKLYPGQEYGCRKNVGTSNTDEDVWILYGLFQLSDHLVCSNGTAEDQGICNMDCNKLLDDDIQDDIACVLNIVNALDNVGSGEAANLRKMIRLIFQRECRYISPDEYFAECSG